jgi:hypothetical protein
MGLFFQSISWLLLLLFGLAWYFWAGAGAVAISSLAACLLECCGVVVLRRVEAGQS